VDSPPDKETLRKIWNTSGQELKKFFNTSGIKYRELGLKEKLSDMSDDDQLDLLASDGMLIKRPLVTDGEKVSVGFKEEMFAEVWGK
jgi:arsenate reductase